MYKLVVTLCLVVQLANMALARSHDFGAADAPVVETPIKEDDSDDALTRPLSFPFFTSNYYDITFTLRSTSNVAVKRKMPKMTAMTLCLWINSTDDGARSTMFAYAAHGENKNEITFYNPKGLMLSVGSYGHKWITGIKVNDGKWHHVCVTWENEVGRVRLYKDGAQEKQSTLAKGYEILGGGSPIIGNDLVEGKFDTDDAYIGEVTGINMWNQVLDPNVIADMSKTCGNGASGNVLTWGDVISGEAYGQAQITPSTCVNRNKCQ